MLAGLKPARNLLEPCSLASLRLSRVCDHVAFSKVHHASKSEDLFACTNQTDLTWTVRAVLVVYVKMADVAEEVVTACCSLVLAAGLGSPNILNKRKKCKHSTWVKPYIRQRESLGAYNALLSELPTHKVTRCVQYKWTARLDHQSSCYHIMLGELNWPVLSDRRREARLSLFSKAAGGHSAISLMQSISAYETNMPHWSHKFHPHLCTNWCLQIFVLSTYTSRLEHSVCWSSSQVLVVCKRVSWSGRLSHDTPAVKGDAHCWILAEELKNWRTYRRMT